jgi:signal transduction histidine kinase
VNPSNRLRHGRAVMVLALVVSFFIGLVDMGVFLYQRRAVMEQAKTGLAEELALVDVLVRAPMLQHQLSSVSALLEQWAREQDRVISLRAVAANGFVMVDYSRPANPSWSYGLTRESSYAGRRLLTITVVEELGREASQILALALWILGTSVVLVFLMVLAVWGTVRRMALRPLEEEISRRETVEKDLQLSRQELEDRVRDRTLELARSKEDLERRNEELKKLDSMKDGLVRDVTHELKTPVAKQAMQMELLKDVLARHRLEEETGAVIKVMEASIRRQEEVIRNILNLARLEGGGLPGRLDEVRLDALLEDVLNEYAPTMEEYGIRVEKDLEPVSVLAEQEMLWHVFSNLVNNAIKFRTKLVRPSVSIRAAVQDGRALVLISDNGIGLEPDEKERVFERFYQASAAFEGSGVGLTIARKIVEDLGGTIRVDSAGREKGVLVTVILPLGRQ